MHIKNSTYIYNDYVLFLPTPRVMKSNLHSAESVSQKPACSLIVQHTLIYTCASLYKAFFHWEEPYLSSNKPPGTWEGLYNSKEKVIEWYFKERSTFRWWYSTALHVERGAETFWKKAPFSAMVFQACSTTIGINSHGTPAFTQTTLAYPQHSFIYRKTTVPQSMLLWVWEKSFKARLCT